MHEHVTLLRPDVRRPEPRGVPWTLPPDLLGQSVARLRVLALLSLRLAEVDGVTAWTQDRARDRWATHQPVLTS